MHIYSKHTCTYICTYSKWIQISIHIGLSNFKNEQSSTQSRQCSSYLTRKIQSWSKLKKRQLWHESITGAPTKGSQRFFYSSCFFIPFPLGKLEVVGTVGGNECWETNRTKSSSATGNFPNSRDSIKPPLLMETARVILSKKSQTPDSSHTDLSIELKHIFRICLHFSVLFVTNFHNLCNIFSCRFFVWGSSWPMYIAH